MRIVDLANLPQVTAVKLQEDLGAVTGPIIVDQCAQIVLNWSLESGKTAHNVLYGRFSGAFAGTAAQANSIHAAVIAGAAWSTFAGFLAPSTIFTGCSIRNVDVRDQALIPSTGANGPGVSAGTALPSEVAAVVTLRTAKTGRGNRGRAYIGGFASNSLGTGNVIAAAAVTALQTWFQNNVMAAINNNGYTFALGQKERIAYTSPGGVVHPARPSGGEPITSATVRDNHWDTQRRRGLK